MTRKHESLNGRTNAAVKKLMKLSACSRICCIFFRSSENKQRGPSTSSMQTLYASLWSYLFLCGLMSFPQPGQPSVKSCAIHSFLIWVTASCCIPMQPCEFCIGFFNTNPLTPVWLTQVIYLLLFEPVCVSVKVRLCLSYYQHVKSEELSYLLDF